MSGLEQSYYIIGIVFMSVMFILITVIVATMLVVRNKVVSLERTVEEKLHAVASIPETIMSVVSSFKDFKKSGK